MNVQQTHIALYKCSKFITKDFTSQKIKQASKKAEEKICIQGVTWGFYTIFHA